MSQPVNELKHPLIQHKLSLMRSKETPSHEFRSLLREISLLMAYEVTRDFPTNLKEIETPVAKMQAPFVDSKKVVLVSILRAGNGILDGMLEVVPFARVGHIGLYRDPKTLGPVEYYFKVPVGIDQSDVIIVDPMLATGNSAVAAVARIKTLKPKSLKFVCLVSSPEGIEVFQHEHPDVPIFTACIDQKLNDHGYIVPGLGDAGDRIYGTK